MNHRQALRLVAATLAVATLTFPASALATQPDADHLVPTCQHEDGWVKVEDNAVTNVTITGLVLDIDWTGDGGASVAYSVAPGYTLDVCIKSGKDAFTPGDAGTDGMRQTSLGLTGEGTVTLDKDVSHFSYRLNTVPVIPPIPLPPVLADLCVPATQLQALADAHVAGTIVGSIDVALANNDYALVTFEREGDNGPYIQSLGGVTPEADDTPCPVPVPPATDTPRPDNVVPPAAPVVEVDAVTLEQPADVAADVPEEVPTLGAVANGQLPMTGIKDWLAPLSALLIAAGVVLRRKFRSA